MVMMFLGPGYNRPWQLGGAVGIAGVGVWLLRTPERLGRGVRERTRHPVLLLFGVFFTFGTIGPLFFTVFQPSDAPPVAGLFGVAIAGLIAVGWASAFMFRLWWLVPVVVLLQVAAPRAIFQALLDAGVIGNFGGLDEQARRGVLALQAVLCVVVGYVLLVRFIRLTESEQARARAELDVARSLHAQLVPTVEVSAPGVCVHGRSDASSEMGGDLIDAVVCDGWVDVFVADVSGHGVGAGVVMAMVKSAIRTRLGSTEDLGEVVRDVNRVLVDLTPPSMFATFACVRVPTGGGTRRATCAMAGHLPIFVVRSGGEITEIENESLPLGVVADEGFACREFAVGTGDVAVLLTDGLTEARDGSGREFMLDGVRGVLRRMTESGAGGRNDAREVCGLLLAAARAHGHAHDDQSVIAVRID